MTSKQARQGEVAHTGAGVLMWAHGRSGTQVWRVCVREPAAKRLPSAPRLPESTNLTATRRTSHPLQFSFPKLTHLVMEEARDTRAFALSRAEREESARVRAQKSAHRQCVRAAKAGVGAMSIEECDAELDDEGDEVSEGRAAETNPGAPVSERDARPYPTTLSWPSHAAHIAAHTLATDAAAVHHLGFTGVGQRRGQAPGARRHGARGPPRPLSLRA